MRLNLGCSTDLKSGFVNVDRVPPADWICDLAVEPWPWEDSSIEMILANDIIEHLPDHKLTMNEAWRVLIPGGIFDIAVPTTDGRGATQDPDHKSLWNRNSFFYYEYGNLHLTRFAPANGVHCAFKIIRERQESLPDHVEKLFITLAAVK